MNLSKNSQKQNLLLPSNLKSLTYIILYIVFLIEEK